MEDWNSISKHGICASDHKIDCIYKERTGVAGGMGAGGAGVKFTGNPISKIRKRRTSKGGKTTE